MGTGVERTQRGRGGTETGGVWEDHWQTLLPYIRAQINREGRTQRGREQGRQRGG